MQKNKYFNTILILAFSLFSIEGMAQKNPGYLGKKFAVGYGLNYSYGETFNIRDSEGSKFRTALNNTLFAEFAIAKYKSLSFDYTFQNVPVTYSTYDGIQEQDYQYGPKVLTANFSTIGGVSDFRYQRFGLKMSFFNSRKTIASPIGFANYFRISYMKADLVKDEYKYKKEDNTPIPTGAVPIHTETGDSRVSVGWGIETKVLLNEYIFLKVNAELNVSGKLIGYYVIDLNYTTPQKIDDFHKDRSLLLNHRRDLLLVGFSLGALVF